MSRNQTYRVSQNVFFVMSSVFKWDKLILLFTGFLIPALVLTKLANVYLTKSIVEAAIGGQGEQLIRVVMLFAVFQFCVNAILQFSEAQLNTRNYKMRMQHTSDFVAQYMHSDFDIIESVEGKDKAQRAKDTLFHFSYWAKPSIEYLPVLLASLAGNVLGLFVYGGFISLLNPLIIVALTVTVGISYMLQKALVKYDHKDKKRYVPIERKIAYVQKEAQNFKSVKDIRLFGISRWLKDIFHEQLDERMALIKKRCKLQYSVRLVVTIMNNAFTGFIYFYLIHQFIVLRINIAEFIMYFALITGFNSWLLSIIDNIEALFRCSYDIDDLRAFHDIAVSKNQGGRKDLDTGNCSIEFADVSFAYRGTSSNTIDGMSFFIHHGEKIAIVGANGAGKTTLVKLLCGLYAPTGGSIQVCGIDLQRIDKQTLFKLFSPVFQDVYLLPASIKSNIVLSDYCDEERFHQCLALSGISDKVASFPEREQTLLLKSVMDHATELSGGEIQKLALARALYKDGSIMVLDEPTAALDPIAESAMYQKYNMLTQGRTAIFISHRFSSTRFCDRIFFVEDGRIIECGSHEQLMSQNGKYAAMYHLQSHYYQESKEVYSAGHAKSD